MTDYHASEGEWYIPMRKHLDRYFADDGRCAIWDAIGDRWVWSDSDSRGYNELNVERQRLLDALEIEKAPRRGLDDELEVNSRGGKQSKLSTRFDLVPPGALHAVARTLHEGAEKYGERNWRKINAMSHLNHALEHLNNYRGAKLNPDEWSVNIDEELAHAVTRLLMALEIELVGEDEDGDEYA